MNTLEQFDNRVALMLITITCLNVCDGIMTSAWMDLGIIEEANPLMAYLLDLSPQVFLWTKLTLVPLGCFILWRYRIHRLSTVSMVVILGIYCWILVLHFRVWRLLETYGLP